MIIMADADTPNMEDLEDGEIESDAEQAGEEAVATPEVVDKSEAKPPQNATILEEPKMKPPDKPHSKKSDSKHDRKKSKDHHSKNKSEREHKSHKDKGRKFLLPTPVEDDYAGNIEKAIRMALTKGNDNTDDPKNDNEKFDSGVDVDNKRKHKKRKKHSQPDKDVPKKKRKREEVVPEPADEMDEDEMMCVRGASPVFKQTPAIETFNNYPSEEEYDSASSEDSRGGGGRDKGRGGRGRSGGNRGDRRQDKGRMRSRRQDVHPQQDPDGVCLFYMQGKCYKGDDCTYSHDAQPPRKMELCKFYLMDCCAKRDKCLYLHSDFPCKYYHTGLQCVFKDDCKFAHGKPLSENLRQILLKHIESAPKEILGDFPRLSREAAAMMLAHTQNKLMQQFSPTKSGSKEKSIPSIFDLNVPKPAGFDENHSMNSMDSSNNDKNRNSSKVRQSRWCDSSSASNNIPNSAIPSNHSLVTDNILCVQNLNGVLTPTQISELLQLGIENLNQLSQLTVIQLNQIGLTMNQINEIQLNTMSIQKLGLINNQSSNSNPLFNNVKSNKDLDMRVSPGLSEAPIVPKSEISGQDVDMRFQTAPMHHNIEKDNRNVTTTQHSSDPRKQKSNIDIDQYTKDALKFSKVEKESSSIPENDSSKENQENTVNKKPELDIDHRVLKYISDATVANVKLSMENNEEENKEDVYEDKKINSLSKHQESYLNTQKKLDQRARRITTDDEDDNLQIDEKWYSSDEETKEKNVAPKEKTPTEEVKPKFYTPTVDTNVLEPTTVITKLGDLSKIDISAEVTKLLSTIKNNTLPEEKEVIKKEESKLRDPRNTIKKSPEHKSTSEPPKKSSKPPIVSIYNCIEGGGGDSRKRTDIDLRPIKDLDFRLPAFGDTDLRQTPGSGDVDLRLGLPFKPLPNYTPASEIDGSLKSHPPILFKLVIVDVPRPDYTDIRNSTPKSQAASDPRLRKIFRLSLDESPSDSSDKQSKPSKSARIDPRKRTQETNEKQQSPKNPPLDVQAMIQTSEWYKELSSNQKILVNQQLASVNISLKKFHQDSTPGKVFDTTEIHSNNVLTKIFANLGIILNEKGEFIQVKLPETSVNTMPPIGFNQNEAFGNVNMPGMMENVGMMSMSMGPPSMGPMGNFDMRYQGGDPRAAPGLLGIAPGVPHNFDGNFNNMPNFNNDNNFNNGGNFDNSQMFNGPGGNMNEYRGDNNYDEKFNNYRNQKNDFKPYRGGRGGNERWRGSRGRDRRGFSERGGNGNGNNWKGDRR